MRLGRWLLVGLRFGPRRGWRREGGLGVVLFRQVRDFYFLRLRLRRWRVVGLKLLRGLLRLGRRRIGLVRLWRCDRRWRRQIRSLVRRRRRSGRWGGLRLGHLRPWRDLLRRRWRSNRERRQIDHDRGRLSVRRRFGLAPVERPPGRGEMDRSHNDRRHAPAKPGKRRLPPYGPAIAVHGRGGPFVGSGAGAPAALGPEAPLD